MSVHIVSLTLLPPDLIDELPLFRSAYNKSLNKSRFPVTVINYRALSYASKDFSLTNTLLSTQLYQKHLATLHVTSLQVHTPACSGDWVHI